MLPGDDLLLSFEFEHEMNVDEVRVVLVHAENPRDRVVLVDDEPSQVDERHTISGKILKRSEVHFRETITGS